MVKFSDNLGQVFDRKFGFRASSFEPSGNQKPPSERASLLSLSLSCLSAPNLLPTQDSSYNLEMWKLSMKELDWTNNSTVVLDMKSQIRHFREQLGFEVPPPPSLSSSVQRELAISLSSCNLSSPDSPSSVASQTPTTQHVCHPCCGPSVWSVQSFDLLACQTQSVFPLTCVMSRSLSVVTQCPQASPCIQS